MVSSLDNVIYIYRIVFKTAFRGYQNKKNDKIKTNYFIPEGPKTQANKIGIDFMIFILIFVTNRM